MTEEIKEILDIIKDINNYDTTTTYKDNKITTEYDMYISKENVDKLLDYIANLQQENEILKENAEHKDKVVDKARWNEMIYKSRCEKANKWVDKHTVIYTKNGISIIDWDNLSDPRKLKNILNGSDE